MTVNTQLEKEIKKLEAELQENSQDIQVVLSWFNTSQFWWRHSLQEKLFNLQNLALKCYIYLWFQTESNPKSNCSGNESVIGAYSHNRTQHRNKNEQTTINIDLFQFSPMSRRAQAFEPSSVIFLGH